MSCSPGCPPPGLGAATIESSEIYGISNYAWHPDLRRARRSDLHCDCSLVRSLDLDGFLAARSPAMLDIFLNPPGLSAEETRARKADLIAAVLCDEFDPSDPYGVADISVREMKTRTIMMEGVCARLWAAATTAQDRRICSTVKDGLRMLRRQVWALDDSVDGDVPADDVEKARQAMAALLASASTEDCEVGSKAAMWRTKIAMDDANSNGRRFRVDSLQRVRLLFVFVYAWVLSRASAAKLDV